MSKLILISLLIFVASKNLAIEFGEEVKTTTNFNLTQEIVMLYLFMYSSNPQTSCILK